MRLALLTFLLLGTLWADPSRAQVPAGAPADQAEDSRRAQAGAHLRAGDPAKAVPLLDALVSAHPQDVGLRLELAHALLKTGEHDRARHHLLQARGSGQLTREERRSLDSIVARLEGGRSYEAWARLAIVPERNPGQRTDAETVHIGGLDWLLNPGARAAPATGLHLGFGGALLPRIGPSLRLRLGGSLDARLYRDSRINDVTVAGQFGLQGLSPGGTLWDVHLSAKQRHIGGPAYGRALGLHAGWTRTLGERAQIRLRLDAERWRHTLQTGQDGWRHGMSLAMVQAVRPDLLLRGTVFANHTSARVPWEAGSGLGASVGVQKLFQGGLILSLDLTHLRNRRDAADPLFGVARKDRRNILSARIMHRSITVKGFAPALEIGLDRQKSTIPLNDFRNARLSLGFSREF